MIQPPAKVPSGRAHFSSSPGGRRSPSPKVYFAENFVKVSSMRTKKPVNKAFCESVQISPSPPKRVCKDYGKSSNLHTLFFSIYGRFRHFLHTLFILFCSSKISSKMGTKKQKPGTSLVKSLVRFSGVFAAQIVPSPIRKKMNKIKGNEIFSRRPVFLFRVFPDEKNSSKNSSKAVTTSPRRVIFRLSS